MEIGYKNTKDNSGIISPEKWAESLWAQAAERWSNRTGQDKSYRYNVIHPAIADIISCIYNGKNIGIVDAGCGDGILLEDKKIKSLIEGGEYLGLDGSGELLKRARKQYSGRRINFRKWVFGTGKSIANTGMENKWDIAISVLVIQEIPSFSAFLREISTLLHNRGKVIIITIHPDFAEWLLDSGKMEKYPPLSNPISPPEWRWAGAYPIVDEPREAFYLPYFHRTIEDYTTLAHSSGLKLERIYELPGGKSIKELVDKGISPFLDTETNLYWPGISEIPSALAFVLGKEEVNGNGKE